MNTANYLKNGKYPLSTETLSFIQDQIKLLEALAGLGGKNYIIQPEQGRWYRSHNKKGKDRHHRKGRKGGVGTVGQPDIFTANQICDGFNRKKEYRGR